MSQLSQLDNMESMMDRLYQTMFTIVPKGYSAKEVDMFIEEMKDECLRWNEKYMQVQIELWEMKERMKNAGAAGQEAGD